MGFMIIEWTENLRGFRIEGRVTGVWGRKIFRPYNALSCYHVATMTHAFRISKMGRHGGLPLRRLASVIVHY
jgi:hypothetical protein